MGGDRARHFPWRAQAASIASHCEASLGVLSIPARNGSGGAPTLSLLPDFVTASGDGKEVGHAGKRTNQCTQSHPIAVTRDSPLLWGCALGRPFAMVPSLTHVPLEGVLGRNRSSESSSCDQPGPRRGRRVSHVVPDAVISSHFLGTSSSVSENRCDDNNLHYLKSYKFLKMRFKMFYFKSIFVEYLYLEYNFIENL